LAAGLIETMLNKNTVLVVGGAGYIGSHMLRLLQDQGIALLVLDDLSSSFSGAVLLSDLIVCDSS
jgi:UDP-glucose 4-epimerase